MILNSMTKYVITAVKKLFESFQFIYFKQNKLITTKILETWLVDEGKLNSVLLQALQIESVQGKCIHRKLSLKIQDKYKTRYNHEEFNFIGDPNDRCEIEGALM